MAYDLKPLVDRAVLAFKENGRSNTVGLFRSTGFAKEVQREFELKHCPGAGWASQVLEGLPYVERMRRDLWRRSYALPSLLDVYRSRATEQRVVVHRISRGDDGPRIHLKFVGSGAVELIVTPASLEQDFERIGPRRTDAPCEA